MEEKLTSLPNLGGVLEQQLFRAGIRTPGELQKIGSREAWLRIQAFDPSACYNRLCALEGAVRGVRWHSLPEDLKAELKAFYREHRV